jgi:ribonuclease HI
MQGGVGWREREDQVSCTEQDLKIYTDGACLGNPGPGGWGAVLVRGCHYREIGGMEGNTTNNRMEMRAAIEGLGLARAGERVALFTDSRYLHDGISKWIHAWKRRGWRKADGGEVLNRDLWEMLDRLCYGGRIRAEWHHVRGHSGHALNERCDAIATAFARGEVPDLRTGDGAWIPGLQGSEVAAGLHYPAYLSLVEGELRFHADWADCESWVKGKKGARYRKANNAVELVDILDGWGVAPEERAAWGR